jgi:hypothetical protein
VKTLCQKLIKIDILKNECINTFVRAKKLSEKYMQKKNRENGRLEGETDQNRENWKPIF